MEKNEIFNESVSFDEMGLRDEVLKGVREAGFVHPTNIQAQMIPAAVQGQDVLGQAKTGTGKTAAFGLPILHQADASIPMQALILVPTRELAAQVSGELEELGQFTPIRTTCIIGGESMRQQLRSVEQGGHILVGTPGRIMDLHSRGDISFKAMRFVVLDEVDRMLDIGFRDDIRKILGQVRGDHQTIFVSATINPDIERLARRFLRDDAVKIEVASGSLTVSLVDQKYLPVKPWDKQKLLLHLIREERPDTTVVFCRTKATVHRLTQYLRDKKVNVREIHGDLAQAKRTKVMQSFRDKKLDVLVASDLAARGLDVEHVTHVINYDLPDDPEVYIHRIGRTARAGRRGIAWSFVSPEQGQLLTEIEKLAGVIIEQLDYPNFKPGPVPEGREEVRRKVIDPIKKQASRVTPQGYEGLSEEELAKRFPNGVVPKSLPRRSLGSRFRTRRR